jgi:hypothetical protein
MKHPIPPSNMVFVAEAGPPMDDDGDAGGDAGKTKIISKKKPKQRCMVDVILINVWSSYKVIVGYKSQNVCVEVIVGSNVFFVLFSVDVVVVINDIHFVQCLS